MTLSELYASVTRDIITQLEAGTAPWTRPWRTGPSARLLPYNAVTAHEYRGINIPILWRAAEVHEYPAHAWLTYRQARAAGAQVRKGERGTTVVFTKRLRFARPSDDEERTVSLLRRYVVFNVAQVDGLTVGTMPVPAPVSSCPGFVAATGAVIHAAQMPMYVPSRDLIAMPPCDLFESQVRYYATLLHELVHWSGAPHRLDRDLSGRFGTHQYAAEELIAEFGAAFLCAHLGITGELRHADYIAGWLALLKQDDRAVFTAASKASQAADFLRAFSEAEFEAVPEPSNSWN
jgi:antirestriction protein ArdC